MHDCTAYYSYFKGDLLSIGALMQASNMTHLTSPCCW
ncbi:MAG: hypothetical protein ACI8VY_001591, partial [Cellvibrionaceae bacterium]